MLWAHGAMLTQSLGPVTLALKKTVSAAQLDTAMATLSVCVLPAGMLMPVQVTRFPSRSGFGTVDAGLGSALADPGRVARRPRPVAVVAPVLVILCWYVTVAPGRRELGAVLVTVMPGQAACAAARPHVPAAARKVAAIFMARGASALSWSGEVWCGVVWIQEGRQRKSRPSSQD